MRERKPVSNVIAWGYVILVSSIGILAFYNTSHAAIYASSLLSGTTKCVKFTSSPLSDCLDNQYTPDADRTIRNILTGNYANPAPAVDDPVNVYVPYMYKIHNVGTGTLQATLTIPLYPSGTLTLIKQVLEGDTGFAATIANGTAAMLNSASYYDIRFQRNGTMTTNAKLLTYNDTNDYTQWQYIFYNGQNALTIDSPQAESIHNVDTALQFSGNCSTGTIHTMISDQPTYASSTYANLYDTTCSSGVYGYTTTMLQNQQFSRSWYATATTSTEFAQNHFTIYRSGELPIDNPPTSECNPVVSWSCPSAYLLGFDICQAGRFIVNDGACSVQRVVQAAYTKVSTAKPYAYIFQTWDLFRNLQTLNASSTFPAGLFDSNYSGSLITDLTNDTNATSTIRFAPTIMGHQIELFNSRTSLDSTAAAWDTLRPYMNLLIYIGFGAYVLFRFVL